jgi:hypothetical protein
MSEYHEDDFSTYTILTLRFMPIMRALFMAIPIVQLPLLNLSTHPFDLLLAGIGIRMMQLARTNKPFQALLVDRNFVMQIESQDGIARNFTIADGQVKMASGHAPKADFTLRFRDGHQFADVVQSSVQNDCA